MWPNPQESADLVTYTGEILNGKLHFLCSAFTKKASKKNFIFCSVTLHKNWSFALTISSVNVSKSAVSLDLVTFTKEILNGKLHFSCSVSNINSYKYGNFIYCMSEKLAISLSLGLPNIIKYAIEKFHICLVLRDREKVY